MPESKPRQMPKGGRKGGAVFPRVSLNDALQYARKLVSKTHTSVQPKDVILSGVVGAKSGKGEVRMSALKQYGFLKGDTKTGFSADDLAKKIAAAPPEETVILYHQAILRPNIFKKLFDTFHGDTVTKAKLKQRASDLKVHPDETETCVDLYISGMALAELVTVNNDQVIHIASSELGSAQQSTEMLGQTDHDTSSTLAAEEAKASASPSPEPPSKDNKPLSRSGTQSVISPAAADQNGPRAVFNVNVSLDSSLDIEKLQKQLELLKRFGAIEAFESAERLSGIACRHKYRSIYPTMTACLQSSRLGRLPDPLIAWLTAALGLARVEDIAIHVGLARHDHPQVGRCRVQPEGRGIRKTGHRGTIAGALLGAGSIYRVSLAS